MRTAARARPPDDSFLGAVRTEALDGSENLASWLKHVSRSGGIPLLFALESWLRGLGAFLKVEHLALTGAERSSLLDRSFAPELRIVRRALESTGRLVTDV